MTASIRSAVGGNGQSAPAALTLAKPTPDTCSLERHAMDDVRTRLLGQFEDDVALVIGERLTARGIVWWEKRSGGLTRMLFAADWGTRLFVDDQRFSEAQQIADAVRTT